MTFKLCFFSLFLSLACVSISHAQQIEVKQTLWEKIYLLEGEKLSVKDINKLTQPYPMAQEHMEKAMKARSTATVFSVIGGGLLGWGVGSLIFSNEPSYVTLGLGATLIIIGIPISNSSKRNVYKAVNIYNDAQAVGFETQPKTNLKLSVSGNGLGLSLQF